jgi:vacuolar protein sorting-associated protein 35
MDVYKETVLPRIIELIISSKDPISQQYLIDCTISTFPDDYHLGTL